MLLDLLLHMYDCLASNWLPLGRRQLLAVEEIKAGLPVYLRAWVGLHHQTSKVNTVYVGALQACEIVDTSRSMRWPAYLAHQRFRLPSNHTWRHSCF